MLKNASGMAKRKWEMEKTWQFALSHLPFPIRPGFFSGLLGGRPDGGWAFHLKVEDTRLVAARATFPATSRPHAHQQT
jgi:hypothetical protein